MFRPLYDHLQVLSTIHCKEISISSWVMGGGGRDLTLQCMGGIGLVSGVLGALPGLGHPVHQTPALYHPYIVKCDLAPPPPPMTQLEIEISSQCIVLRT
jgi:hypothetical protein